MAAKIQVGFELHCPHCNERGAIKLDLNDLREDLECGNCNETIRCEAAIQLFEDRMQSWVALKRFLLKAETLLESGDAFLAS